jgi:TonB family protein
VCSLPKFALAALIAGMLAAGAPARAQARPYLVRMTPAASAKLIIKKVNPKYPEDLRKQGVRGVVVLKIRISKTGDVTDIALVSGPAPLAPYSIEAVRQWKYKPFLLNGNPLVIDTEVRLIFPPAEH